MRRHPVRRGHSAGILLVFVTCPSRAVGQRLARLLVRRRLAACVNVLPGVQSVFWWEGKLDTAREVLLLIKTTRARLPVLRRTIVREHPYELPEVIAVPLVAGHPPYLAWVAATCSPHAH